MKSLINGRKSVRANSARRRAFELQSLEPRALLSVVIVNPHKATYSDIDGDQVSIAITTGTLTGANFVTAPSGLGDQLQTIDLTAAGFENAKITFTIIKAQTGDGFANVGYINAAGHDLAAVSINGDLGVIDAGNPAKPASAIASLTVRSIGSLGTTTGAPDLQSNIDGALGKLTVTTDVKEAYLKVVDTSGKQKANIGPINIGQSLIGGAATNSGYLYADNLIGTVTIGGDLQGGSGDNSGRIASGHPFSSKTGIGAVKILGSMKGSTGADSGSLYSNSALASLFIGVNLEGGTNYGAGNIAFFDKPASKITINGDFIGGEVNNSTSNTGEITASGGLGAFYVGGDMLGGGLTNLGSAKFGTITIVGSLEGGDANFSGNIQNRGTTGVVKIGGNLKGGAGDESGELALEKTVTSISIGGDVIGGDGQVSGNINCNNDGSTTNSITIAGSVIGGNFNQLSGVVLSFGKITTLTIGGDLVGGDASLTGIINPPASTNYAITTLKIGGSIIGGAGTRSGSVWSLGTISNMTVGGSLSSGTGVASGGIRADFSIGSLTIEHDVTGNDTQPVYITSRGRDDGSSRADVAITKIVIKGNVTRAQILAGWNAQADQNAPSSHKPAAVNGNASIGTILVNGTWSKSDIVAGAFDSGANGFGRNDGQINGPTPAVSKITSVTILGPATGSTNGAEYFGIVAQQIGKLLINGNPFSTTTGKDHGEIDQGNHNFSYLEV